MAWVPKVRRHCTVLILKTVGGNTAYVKRRPCVITSIPSGTNITGRVGHFGETQTNRAQYRQSVPRTNKYYMG